MVAAEADAGGEARTGSERDGLATGSGRRPGRAPDRQLQLSKALSKLLRHQADKAGIKLDDEGFAPLDQVLAWGPLRSLKASLAEVQAIVATNDKQRFSLKLAPSAGDQSSSSGYLIRANQGHSIKLDSSALLERVRLEDAQLPRRLLHGTFFVFWPAIVASGGLKPMGRTHIHCSTGTPEEEGVVSGMRRDAELLIEIDLVASLREGIAWWRSQNGVLLTEGDESRLLPARFFKSVTGRTINVGILWENGEKKADLPASIRAKMPQGKGPRNQGRGGRGRQEG